MSRSNRIFDYLKKLPQFTPSYGECIDVRTGARVFVPQDPDSAEEGTLLVEFPGGDAFEVNGDLYWEVAIVDAVRLWSDLGQIDGTVGQEVQGQIEHYKHKVGE